jgi:predicted dehydrogenase
MEEGPRIIRAARVNDRICQVGAQRSGTHYIQARDEYLRTGKLGKIYLVRTWWTDGGSEIDVGKGPDGIYFDPASHRVFTNNHGSHDVSVIDALTGELVGTVKLEGDGEQPVIAGSIIYASIAKTPRK